MARIEITEFKELLDVDELEELKVKLHSMAMNADYYQLSHLESRTLDAATQVVFECFMAAKFPKTVTKLNTGGRVTRHAQ